MRPPGRTVTRVAIALAVLFGIGWGGADSLESAPSTTSPRSSVAAGCRSNPLTGVHDPTRLKILDACATFVGTVVKAPKLYADRDVAFDVAPDKGYESMLNEKNRRKGGIHVEIIPIDQRGCTSGCSGANVNFPPVGAHVRVTGARVYDSWVGWNEIHPTWKLQISTASPPSATIRLRARLTGREVRGSGKLALSVTGEKVCWRFSWLTRLKRPTRAMIRAGAQTRGGPLLLALGSHYRTRGCLTADLDRLKPLTATPHSYYMVVATARHPRGAVRGQLTSTD
jgi:CHRD domain